MSGHIRVFKLRVQLYESFAGSRGGPVKLFVSVPVSLKCHHFSLKPPLLVDCDFSYQRPEGT